MKIKNQFVSLNGQILPVNEALIYPGHSGFYYGAGCFETFLAIDSKIFKFSEHIERLNNGVKYLGNHAVQRVYEDKIYSQIIKLLDKSGLSEKRVRIRLQVWLDERKGYNPGDKTELISFITLKPVINTNETCTLITAGTRTVPSVCKPSNLKLSNMLHYRNAFREAKSMGANDALLLTVNQKIAETSIANIFWKKGTEVYTPSAECDILPGITRNTVCEIISGLSYINIHEGHYLEDAIYDADTAWTTNSIAGICEVTRLNDYLFNTDNEFIDSLRKKLMARMEQPE